MTPEFAWLCGLCIAGRIVPQIPPSHQRRCSPYINISTTMVGGGLVDEYPPTCALYGTLSNNAKQLLRSWSIGACPISITVKQLVKQGRPYLWETARSLCRFPTPWDEIIGGLASLITVPRTTRCGTLSLTRWSTINLLSVYQPSLPMLQLTPHPPYIPTCLLSLYAIG